MLSSISMHVWQAPEFTSLNKLPPRATFLPFKSPIKAARAKDNSVADILPLDGAWDFRSEPDPEAAIAAFGNADLEWGTIPVPGHPEFHGHGDPHYTNIRMPWPHLPPHVPTNNPRALYRRTFSLPSGWGGQRIVVHFGGATSVLAVILNGELVGVSKDSCLPAEFDLTRLVRREGENTLIAMVVKWSDASFLEDQDQWWLSGLHREVFLYAAHRGVGTGSCGPDTLPEYQIRGRRFDFSYEFSA